MSSNLNSIAIIGMAGRFPGAANVDEFWSNLLAGRESISFFSDEELAQAGLDVEAIRRDPTCVAARGIIENAEWFDAAFFGFGAKEAEITDPQQRLFLEVAWEALENAGYNPNETKGYAGVFAGMSNNTYGLNNLNSNPELVKLVGRGMINIGNEKDHLATRVAYKLNLRGPALSINTACSTSLVAVCQACQALLSYQCDLALAGGVSIFFPQKRTYYYQEGSMLSRDGSCRPFDAKATGTNFSDGSGVVVLKRLENALEDGDQIHAIIKGTGINNDGSAKVGYTAPSVDGQAEVVALAMAVADVKPASISYVEAHGTATPLGDPIEIAALNKAFRANTLPPRSCGIGSVKGNIGHLDSAAGVAGLIKATLALRHKMLPASLHFERPNPKLDLAHSPFYVNAQLREWKDVPLPRRAGVSSFGFGGTNVHVVLEEAPKTRPSDPSRPWQLLVLSAKSEAALGVATANLAAHLKANPTINLADVAYTLAIGRSGFDYRRTVACRNVAEAIAALESLDPKRVVTGQVPPSGTSMTQKGGHEAGQDILASLDGADDAQLEGSLMSLGRSWVEGQTVNWQKIYGHEKRCRLALPTYPFERSRFFVERKKIDSNTESKTEVNAKKLAMGDWFHVPSWKRTAPAAGTATVAQPQKWLIFVDENGLGEKLAQQLGARGEMVTRVTMGDGYAKKAENIYTINPAQSEDYGRLIADLHSAQQIPGKVVHLWGVNDGVNGQANGANFEKTQECGLYSLLYVAQALGNQQVSAGLQIITITSQVQAVTGEEIICPEKATVLATTKVIPTEFANIQCRSIDVIVPASESIEEQRLAGQLADEILAQRIEPMVAYRGPHRWVEGYEHVHLEPVDSVAPRLRHKGVYLITGGLGGMGLSFAEYLAEKTQAKLVLVGRTALPPEEQWTEWLAQHDDQNETTQRIKKIKSLRNAGAEVITYSANVADKVRMAKILTEAQGKFGKIDGIIHAAGIIDFGGIMLRRTKEATEQLLAAKVEGTRVLAELLASHKPDFVFLCSSIGTVDFGGAFGRLGYLAANEFLDACPFSKLFAKETLVTTINWDTWREIGMTAKVVKDQPSLSGSLTRENTLDAAEGVMVLNIALKYGQPRLLVSVMDLDARKRLTLLELQRQAKGKSTSNNSNATSYKRPQLSTAFVAPASEMEKKLAIIWQELLAIQEIGVADDFFDLGGHSLLGTQLISYLQKDFGFEASLRDIYDNPTITDMAKMLEKVVGTVAAEADKMSKLLEEIALLSDEEMRKISAK